MQKIAHGVAPEAPFSRRPIVAIAASCMMLTSACGVTTRGVSHIDASPSAVRQPSARAIPTAVPTVAGRGALAASDAYRQASGWGSAHTHADGHTTRTARRSTTPPRRSGTVAPAAAIGAASLSGPPGPAAPQARVAVDETSQQGDASRTLPRFLGSPQVGHIALDAPSFMTVGKGTPIRVVLGMRGPLGFGEGDAINDALPDSAASAPRIMEAHLSGAGFEIDAVSSARQAFPTRQPVEWTWLVTPRKAGRHELHLTVSGIASGNGAAAHRLFPTLDHTVEVGVTWSGRVHAFFETHPLWISAALAALLAAALWRYWRSRIKRRRWFHGRL